MRTKPAGSAKGSPSRGSCRRRRLRGFVPEATLSVTAPPCHLSRKGEALARARSLWFTGQLLLSLTNEGETCRFCQGLPLSGELSSGARLRGFFPKAPLSRPATKRGIAGRRGFISPNTKNARSFHCGRLDFPQGSGQTGENSPIRMRLTKRSRLHPSRRSFPAGPGGSQ